MAISHPKINVAHASRDSMRRLDVIAVQEEEGDDQVAEDADAQHEHGKEGIFWDSTPCHEIQPRLSL